MVRTAVGANVNVSYGLLTVVEETLEMTGMVVFIYALMDYIAQRWGGVRIDLRRNGAVSAYNSPAPIDPGADAETFPGGAR
jgi:hypothetical protein